MSECFPAVREFDGGGSPSGFTFARKGAADCKMEAAHRHIARYLFLENLAINVGDLDFSNYPPIVNCSGIKPRGIDLQGSGTLLD
jgi:hypothetical protein